MLSHKLGVEASREFWTAMGWSIGTVNGVEQPTYRNHYHNYDQTLAIAIGNGLDGEAAIAWAASEDQRRAEAMTASTAMARNADALKALADSLRTQADQSVVEKIMRHLTEPTQWALRKQLAGTGLLPSGK